MWVRRFIGLIPLMGALALTQAVAQEAPPAEPVATTDAPAAPVAATAAEADAEKAAAAAAAAEGAFKRDLLTVEQDVDKLKERVFRSKATLRLLKELVLEGSSLGSSVILYHVNRMGAGYTVEEVRYFLDGKNVYARNLVQSGQTGERELMVYEQPVPAGPHNLQVQINLRGNGFGVFSYLQSYSFKLQSSYTFNVDDGQQTTVKVVADEKGGMWKTFVDRPNVEYEESAVRLKSTE